MRVGRLRALLAAAAVAAVAAALAAAAPALADSHTKPYEDGETVNIWANRASPYANPNEAYHYYTLPYCVPDKVVETHAEGLGEALQGYELRKTAMDAQFKRDVTSAAICTKSLSEGEAEQFRLAVREHYWYQLYIDDLPVWGMVGETLRDSDDLEALYLYTHKSFAIAYNADRVIEVNLTSENPVPIAANEPVTFTYSIKWVASATPYERRFDKYLDNNFFEHQIHWFSIFNSFMMVIFLVGLVSMILMRTLRKDYARFAREDDLEDDERLGDETGWKQVHGDVFRPPSNLVLFSALIGSGYQLTILIFFVVFFAILGTYYVKRGTLVTCFVFFYALTSFIAGYAGGGYYARNGGRLWIRNMLIIAGLFPGVIVAVFFVLNTIAIAYQSLAAIPFGTMVAVAAIWLFLSFPLTVVGTIIGKNYDGRPDHPCRIHPVPRRIPAREWYLSPLVTTLLGGVLPFGSIFIEGYFLFSAFYHYKYYYAYGFFLLVYIILIIVTACVTIVSTYFTLNSEDWRWQWRAWASGASTGLYVFLYSCYYFVAKTQQSGLLQVSFFFGHCVLFCVGIALVCGSVGFIATSVFVYRIYDALKAD